MRRFLLLLCIVPTTYTASVPDTATRSGGSGAPAVTAQPQQAVWGMAYEYEGARRATPPVGKWACKFCTVHNSVNSPSCETCLTQCDSEELEEALKRQKAHVSLVQAQLLKGARRATPPVGKWACKLCTVHNSVNSPSCTMCHTQCGSEELEEALKRQKAREAKAMSDRVVPGINPNERPPGWTKDWPLQNKSGKAFEWSGRYITKITREYRMHPVASRNDGEFAPGSYGLKSQQTLEHQGKFSDVFELVNRSQTYGPYGPYDGSTASSRVRNLGRSFLPNPQVSTTLETRETLYIMTNNQVISGAVESFVIDGKKRDMDPLLNNSYYVQKKSQF